MFSIIDEKGIGRNTIPFCADPSRRRGIMTVAYLSGRRVEGNGATVKGLCDNWQRQAVALLCQKCSPATEGQHTPRRKEGAGACGILLSYAGGGMPYNTRTAEPSSSILPRSQEKEGPAPSKHFVRQLLKYSSFFFSPPFCIPPVPYLHSTAKTFDERAALA